MISQSPAGGVAAPTGSTVTLSVSLGPPATPVPDVTSLDEAAATATLQAAGYMAKVVTQPTTDPGQDGIVLSQSPVGGTDAKAGSSVTIFVGSRQPVTRLRVAILAGGRSSEHEISLASARSVLAGLDPERYDVQAVAIGRDGRWELGPGGEAETVAETLPVLVAARRRPRSARWTWCCRSCTGPSARTAPCRGCSSWPGSRTSAPGSPPRRSAWTRTCSRR